MKAWALLLALSLQARADEIQCLAETMHAEAAGESVIGAIAVGNNVVNRSARLKVPVCKAAKAGYAQKRIPAPLRAAYRLLAHGIITHKIPDLINGADSFNKGRKPQFQGDIKRVIGKHVHYRINKL